MSTTTETIRKLAAITDPSEFERIASSVLRAADPPLYANLSHPGAQPGGKTIKAPFDNVGWSESTDGSRFVCVAHTTTQGDLKGKWLHDPALVQVRKKGGKPTQPPGDLVKAISEVAEARKGLPDLKVTLALTTNAETPSDVRIAAESMASDTDIALDIWSVSRIADFLDTKPEGQAIRRHYLGRPIELISLAALVDAGYESLSKFGGLPADEEYVEREDVKLSAAHTLLVGDSGAGKTGICSARVKEYLDAGKPAVVLRHELLDSALTLSDALDAELRRQLPNIEESAGSKAVALCKADSPLLVLVEDVNKSSNPSALLNKLANWVQHSDSVTAAPTHWRLLCPIWSRHLDSLDLKDRQKSNLSVVDIGPYTDAQAKDAVQKRARIARKALDEIEAETIANSLGNDALLIALYDFAAEVDPSTVIRQWVQSRIKAVALRGGALYEDLQGALRDLVFEMLSHRVLDPSWEKIKEWRLSPEAQSFVRALLVDGTVIRLQDSEDTARITFRHDRVMGDLVSQVAAGHLKDSGAFPDFLVDPFFAESVGAAVLAARLDNESVLKVMSKSPAVGAYAYKQSVESRSPYEATAFETLKDWLSLAATRSAESSSLRWSVAQVLSEVEGKDVGKLLAAFPVGDRQFDPVLAAAFRNGAFQAGAYWIARYELGTQVPGQQQLLVRMIRLQRNPLSKYVDSELRNAAAREPIRVGALRLAGYLGDPYLASALQHSWSNDAKPALDSYLWAAARCYTRKTGDLLEAICNVWEGLPKEDESPMGTSAEDLAAHGVSWMFARHTPYEAIPFFVAKANSVAKLNWPITYMLRAVDHPDAVEHIARFIAGRPGEHGVITSHMLLSDWERSSREDRRQMSASSKQRLLDLAQSENNTKDLRAAAFRVWETTINPGDVEVARKVNAASPIYARALWARARRQDLTAIPELLREIQINPEYWLQTARYLGSSALLPGIAAALDTACAQALTAPESFNGSMLAEALARLQPRQIEDLLVPRWAELGQVPNFVQVAILTGTPKLRELVAESVRKDTDPKRLFKHISFHLNWNPAKGDKPEYRRQMEALEQYFVHFDKHDLFRFWEICTKRSWLELRLRALDELVRTLPDRYFHLPGEPIETKELEGGLDGNSVHVYHWLPTKIGRGATREDVIDALFGWLDRNLGDPRALAVAADVLREFGARSEVVRLRRYEGNFDNSKLIEELEFDVWSRTLS